MKGRARGRSCHNFVAKTSSIWADVNTKYGKFVKYRSKAISDTWLAMMLLRLATMDNEKYHAQRVEA